MAATIGQLRLTKEEVTGHLGIRVTMPRAYRLRCRIGFALIRLGARIIGIGMVEITDEGQNGRS